MNAGPHWGGDPLPPGMTPDDRIGWEVAATIVVRFVPDPETGKRRGLSVEYHADLPKIVMADQLLTLARELMAHEDFHEGIDPVRVRRDDDEKG